MNKLIIIGSGPAGYTAGIYAGRAGLNPLLFAGEKSGGQLMNTTMVENWPGAKDGVMGPKLMQDLREQAEKFGAKIVEETVTGVDFTSKVKEVYTLEVKYQAEAIIIASGAESIRLNIPGEERLLGRGVAVCAVCDALFYKDKIVAVLGGGDSACEESLALIKFAKKVYLIHRRDSLRASKIMAERVKNNQKIEILWNTEVKEIRGESKVEEVALYSQGKFDKDNQSLNDIHHSEIGNGQITTMKVDGVFLALGHKPATEIFKGKIEMDEAGYIKTFNNTMTSVEGIFAAGDCVDFRYRQAVTAAGMGCQAAIDAEKYLENKGGA